MSGLFSAKAPAYTPPPPPAAPIEEATFAPGTEKTDSALTKRKLGKKRLQIPLGTVTSTTTSSGVNTGV